MRKWVFAGAAVGSLGLIAAVVLVRGVIRSGGSTECSRLTGPNGSPLGADKSTTIAGAQDTAGCPVLVPHLPAARRQRTDGG
jgi:hypothetical protein